MPVLSTYLKNALLDFALGGVDLTPSEYVEVALYTTEPDKDGLNGVEVIGGSYVRIQIANDLAHWPAALAGSKSNPADIVFPRATADWGVVEAVGLLDAEGHLLYIGPTLEEKFVQSGDDLTFEAGELVITHN